MYHYDTILLLNVLVHATRGVRLPILLNITERIDPALAMPLLFCKIVYYKNSGSRFAKAILGERGYDMSDPENKDNLSKRLTEWSHRNRDLLELVSSLPIYRPE